jgi:predicted TIM-barrel fold metal-dependent hydrolase
MYDKPEECMAFLGSLSLADKVKRKLYYDNAKKVGIVA